MEAKMIGGRIAEVRKKLNISQAELAKRLFISPQAVGKWERGESIPNIITLNSLADILGVSLNYFSDNPQPIGHETAPDKNNADTARTEQTLPQTPASQRPPKRRKSRKFTASYLHESDFAGVIIHNGKFKAGAWHKADFNGADLTGSSFAAGEAGEANFDNANLTDCSFSTTGLTGASFNNTTLVRTIFNKSGLARARFTGVKFVDVKLTATDLRETIFENCTFDGVDFDHCDLRGQHFEGHTFIDVSFNRSALDGASFKGATLRNVSFTVPFSVTNKSYLAMKTVSFDGAMMDKLTYAALKALMAVDLSKAIII